MFNYPINVTIDTNVFRACKYDLSENSPLRVLANHVKAGKVRIYLSEIVIKEVKDQLKKQGATLYSLIRNNRNELLKEADKNIVSLAGLKEYITIPDKKKIQQAACARFDDYVKSLNPEILGNSLIDIDGVIEDYFSYNAPFALSGQKRKEFPDAFIVSQIKAGFPKSDSIIISADKGFKTACLKDGEEYTFYNSLGELYKKISEQDKDYNLIISILGGLDESINTAIRDNVENNEFIKVYGLSYDRKGVASGYDYSETSLSSIENVSHSLDIIDEINDDEAIITLECSADIEMDCYYDDYDDAHYDNEEDKYYFLKTVHIIEQHQARFGVRLRLNLDSKEFDLNDVVIVLGGDTRIDRYKATDKEKEFDKDDDWWGKPYTICPECGCGITHKNDGGNGFCINCAPNH